jgi:hypothetical protein
MAISNEIGQLSHLIEIAVAFLKHLPGIVQDLLGWRRRFEELFQLLQHRDFLEDSVL